jgi:hypothetical protein
MIDSKYTQSAENLSKAIDIAITVIQEYPTKKWDINAINHVVYI